MADWVAINRRNSRAVQTMVGWIFWDPGAWRRYEALGVPEMLGYIAARATPLSPAGPDAVIAAFGSLSPGAVRFVFELVEANTTFAEVWSARDEAVIEGLNEFVPDILSPLADLGPLLWPVVDQLPTVGRVLFAAHARMARPTDEVLSGWHAVNCLREWRGDTHWALVAAAGLTGIEASILHNAWLGYERDWLPTSRGSNPDEIAEGWVTLKRRGWVAQGEVTPPAIALRQQIEDETDRLTTLSWELLGERTANWFAQVFEPASEVLLARVDQTAGPNYQPASRVR